LNAEEEPEHPDYPKNAGFKQKFGPRGVLHTYANPDGAQRIEGTGSELYRQWQTTTFFGVCLVRRSRRNSSPPSSNSHNASTRQLQSRYYR
jgi:arylsulfatase